MTGDVSKKDAGRYVDVTKVRVAVKRPAKGRLATWR